MGTAVQVQTHMDDNWIEDVELLDRLEAREEAKAGRAAFLKLDKEAKALILARGISGPVRCGRFIIGAKEIPAKTVESFETSGGVRVSIKTSEE